MEAAIPKLTVVVALGGNALLKRGQPMTAEVQRENIRVACEQLAPVDGDKWRRVVASPLPKQIFALDPIRWLLEKNTVVICSGGGGIPTAYSPDGTRTLLGVEAVIDKDWASELLARELDADILVIATDTDGVYLDWGTPEARRLEKTTPSELADYSFPAGSMGPKVEAACHFVNATGHRAAIGALKDIEAIVAGDAGTQVLPG